MKTFVIIPSRLSATRLPGKPLLKINNLSIISHVFRRAQEANIGEVFVATEDQEIFDDVKKNGGNAVLTSKNHKTGTDRIYEAFQKLNIKDKAVFIEHAKGYLSLGEISIIIAVACKHRDEAFILSRYLIEEIKKRSPIWKKEHYLNNESNWLKGNTIHYEKN